jgi:putative membrane protein
MHTTPLRRPAATALAVGAAAALSLAGAGTASAAPALSSQDQQFLMANEQTNLTELAAGQLTEQKSQNQMSQQLAQVTIADHTTAKNQVTQLAQQLSVTLPTTPNASQQATAAQLQSASGSNFDLIYAQAQVTGHQQSIASTEQEISSGTNTQVKQYAQTYLPLAQKHLQMAEAEVRALGGSTSVAAGSGGSAATNSSNPLGWELGLGVGAVAAVAGGITLTRSRLAQR